MGKAARNPEKTASPRGVAWAGPLLVGFLLGVAWAATAPAGARTLTAGADALEGPSGRGAGDDCRNPPASHGWRAILVGAIKAFSRDQIPAWAAGVTFFSLLALFPALAAFVSLYGLFGDTHQAQRQVLALGYLLPGGAIGVISDQLIRLAGMKPASLGLAFGSSLLISLWSSNAGVKALFAALNAAYEETERRGFLRLNAVSLAFTAGLILFFLLAIASIVAAPATLRLVGLGGLAHLAVLRWPVILVAIAGIVALLYRFGPSHQFGRWRWITPGSLLASFSWLAMSAAFSWYVGNFGNFDRTYGALGGVVGFMTWIWISLMIVLFGAEVNAQIEHRARAKG
jgi:membrane protein